jgi:hypothetical protein
VNRKLHHVFARKRTRSTKIREQALVKRLVSLADYFSEVYAPRFYADTPAPPPKHLLGDV